MMDVLPSILIPVLIDAIAVLGLYVIAAGGRLSAGHAAYFGIGGYVAGLGSIHVGLPPLLSIAFGAALAALVGAAFAIVADRLSHWFFTVTTLVFAVMLVGVVSGVEMLGGATGLYRIPLAVGLTETAVALALAVAFVIWFDSTKFARTLRAVRDSEMAALSLGIDPRKVRVIAFAIGAALAGVAGGLWSHYLGLIKPSDMSLNRSLLYLIYLSIGGTDLWLGGLLGTFLLGFLPEVIRFSRGYRFVLYGCLLALVMVLRPAGLLRSVDMVRLKALLRRIGTVFRSTA
jgi:branched-chain amino acid transport system permease protein